MAVVNAFVEGREVVAQGELLLAGGDTLATVAIDDLYFHFTFVWSPAPPRADWELTGQKAGNFQITGNMDAGGIYWSFPNMGLWSGKQLGLAFGISRYSGNPDIPSIYRISYVFTASAPAISIAPVAR